MSPARDPIKLGTSGWRARVGETCTFANVRRLTRAVAEHLPDSGEAGQGVVVGYDTRFLSEDFAAAAAGTLAQAGVRSRLALDVAARPFFA
jgi:phosphomannomutase